jgi:hypothetical protein
VQTKQNKIKQTPQHNTAQNKTKQKLSSATTKISGFKGLSLARNGWCTRFGGGLELRTAGSTEYKLNPDQV